MAKKKNKAENLTLDAEKKLNETEFIVITDRSGSMDKIANATVDGINEFLNEQKTAPGKAFVTMILFDSHNHYETVYKSRPIEETKPLIVGETYIPNGYTALLDAIGMTINDWEENGRDVVVIINTDGGENDSREYKDKMVIKNMIEAMEKEKGWKFIFLGANQDAIMTGGGMGVSATRSMTYDANNDSVTNMYASLSVNVKSMRMAKSATFNSMVATSTLDTFNMDQLNDIGNTLDFSAKQREEAIK